MVLFLRSLDCNPDPRLQKYCDYLTEESIDYHILCWDRGMKYSDDKIHTYFHKKGAYGTGMKNMSGLLYFNIYLFKYLYKYRKSYRVIHACDFDTILPAMLFKIFARKTLIYDVFDWFVDSRHFHNQWIKKAILMMEKFALWLSDATIICDEERRRQLNYTPKNLWILPNIPNFKSKFDKGSIENRESKLLRLSYVGTMPADRGIEKILECVKNNSALQLDIAGFGIMDKLVKEYSEISANIRFYGTVPYEKGMQIMGESDIIIAIYEKIVLNNVYAAPNKYYEGLFLGKPILTTRGTLVGNHTEKYKTGFVIGESLQEMEDFFKQKHLREVIREYGHNAEVIWEKEYQHYVERFMMRVYIPYISKFVVK